MDIIFALESVTAGLHAAALAELEKWTTDQKYTVHRLLINATDTPEQTRVNLATIDPLGKMFVFCFGPLQYPWAGPIADDGHADHNAPWGSLMPWARVPGTRASSWSLVWKPAGNPARGWGAYYELSSPVAGYNTRPGIGAVTFAGIDGINEQVEYGKYLARLLAYLRGDISYEHVGLVEDHFNYPNSPAPGLGNALQPQIEKAWGAGSVLRMDSIDHQQDTVPAGTILPPYFSEVEGRKLALIAQFSGGLPFGTILYEATTPEVIARGPDCLTMLSFGSYIGDVWQKNDLVRAYLTRGLSSFWIDFGIPDMSLWLTGKQTLGELVMAHAVSKNALSINLMGFPLLSVTPYKPPVSTPQVTLPVEKAVTPMSNIAKVSLSGTADLANVTLTLSAQTTADGLGSSYNFQIFAKRLSDGGYTEIAPRDASFTPLVLNVADGGIPSAVSFGLVLPKDTYVSARVILFAKGSNFSIPLYDTAANGGAEVPLNLTVISDQARVTAPILEMSPKPSFVAPLSSTFAVTGATAGDWGGNTSFHLLPQTPDKAGASGGFWTNPTSFDLNVEINDGKTHSIGLYCVDYGAANRAQKIDVLDAAGTVLQTLDIPLGLMPAHGVIARFNVSGKVRFRVTNTSPSATANAVVSAVFFDAATADTAPVLDTTTHELWVGTYGNEGYIFPKTYVKAPAYTLQTVPQADGQVHFDYVIKYPVSFEDRHYPDGGFWVMLEGFSMVPGVPNPPTVQQWVQFQWKNGTTFQRTANVKQAIGPDNYLYIEGTIAAPIVHDGPVNYQEGLFGNVWGAAGNQFQWVWPGRIVVTGGDSWVAKADPTTFPALLDQRAKLQPMDRQNFGNSLRSLWNDRMQAWNRNPANLDRAYFTALRLRAGAKLLRVVFDPVAYLTDDYYVMELDHVVQEMLAAKVIPHIEPQYVPGSVDALSHLWNELATKYKGLPLEYGIANEPSNFPTWSGPGGWKEVCTRISHEILALDPAAVIWASAPGWSKDIRPCEADPMADGLIKGYTVHTYLGNIAELKAQKGTGKLPVWFQEFNNYSHEWFAEMVTTPNYQGASPWTYNTLGDDGLPLVASAGPPMTFNAAGTAMIAMADQVRKGTFVAVLPPTPPPPPAPVPVTSDDINKLSARIADLEAAFPGVVSSLKTVSDAEAALKADQAAEMARIAKLESTPPPVVTPPVVPPVVTPPVVPPVVVPPVTPSTVQFADNSFEAVGVGIGFPGVFAPGAAWKSANAFVDTVGGVVAVGTPPDGKHVAEIHDGGSLEQVVSGFTPGQARVLSAFVAWRPGFPGGMVDLLIDGVLVGSLIPDRVATVGYTLRTLPFTPTKASHTLTLKGHGVVLIDKVLVSA